MNKKPHQTRASRRLVLVDTQNLAGNPRPTESEIDWIHEKLDSHLGIVPRDLVYVGGHPQSAFICRRLANRFGGAVCLCSGRDGADRVLIERADMLPAAAFDSDLCPVRGCVIASGDHIFTQVARSMAQRGIHVTVVARAGSLSNLLAASADRVILLDCSGVEDEVLAA